MITCCIRYRVDRKKLREFEEYAKLWIALIAKFGGRHHGYFLPGEGKSDEALCLFSFASLADYEAYRRRAASDAEAQEAVRFGEANGALLDWDRTFYRPVLG
jgi:antibiotic biosynthesis monooxygenase (ABM) superfamily enzyme